MNERFKRAYSELELADKRNEFNNEMKVVLKILEMIKQKLGVKVDSKDAIKNYHSINDENLTESEMLDFLYFDFHTIEKNVLDIADFLITKNQEKK